MSNEYASQEFDFLLCQVIEYCISVRTIYNNGFMRMEGLETTIVSPCPTSRKAIFSFPGCLLSAISTFSLQKISEVFHEIDFAQIGIHLRVKCIPVDIVETDIFLVDVVAGYFRIKFCTRA